MAINVLNWKNGINPNAGPLSQTPQYSPFAKQTQPQKQQPMQNGLDINKIVSQAMTNYGSKLDIGGRAVDESQPVGLDWLKQYDNTGGHSWDVAKTMPVPGSYSPFEARAENEQNRGAEMNVGADGAFSNKYGFGSVKTLKPGETPQPAMIEGKPATDWFNARGSMSTQHGGDTALKGLDSAGLALLAKDKGYVAPQGAQAPSADGMKAGALAQQQAQQNAQQMNEGSQQDIIRQAGLEKTFLPTSGEFKSLQNPVVDSYYTPFVDEGNQTRSPLGQQTADNSGSRSPLNQNAGDRGVGQRQPGQNVPMSKANTGGAPALPSPVMASASYSPFDAGFDQQPIQYDPNSQQPMSPLYSDHTGNWVNHKLGQLMGFLQRNM